MSSKVELFRRWHKESWANPPSSMAEAAEKYFSDDYKGFDKKGNVISDKAAYISVSQLLFSAFPDIKEVLYDLSPADDGVIITFRWEGTHTGDFDLSAMGMGVIPASGKKIVTPKSKSRFLVEEGQIVGIQPISGGFESLMAAIGPDMPAA